MLMSYVKQACLLHADCGLPRPTIAAVDYIKIMTAAVKKYKDVPKHQDLIFDGIFHFITHLDHRALHDTFIQSDTNWIILGSYTRFWKSEWCANHPVQFDTITDQKWGNHNATFAIIANDFSYALATGSHILDILSSADQDIVFTTLCIRK